MNISSDRVSFTWLDGSEVNLTCTVELSQILDVTVTLNIEWIGPAGFIANNTAEISNSNYEIYNSTISLNSFRREQAGDYNCTASVSSSSPFLRSSSHYDTKKLNYGELIPMLSHTSQQIFYYLHACYTAFVEISEDRYYPAVGENYTLSCSLSGINVTSFRWIKNGTSMITYGQILSFSQLNLSDAGQYICKVMESRKPWNNSTNIVFKSVYLFNYNYYTNFTMHNKVCVCSSSPNISTINYKE